MNNLLERLYYEGFNLKNSNSKREKYIGQLLGYMSKHEDFLKKHLNDEEKKVFQKYIDCSTDLTTCVSCNEFISGFRLGGRLVAEMFLSADDSEFEEQ